MSRLLAAGSDRGQRRRQSAPPALSPHRIGRPDAGRRASAPVARAGVLAAPSEGPSVASMYPSRERRTTHQFTFDDASKISAAPLRRTQLPAKGLAPAGPAQATRTVLLDFGEPGAYCEVTSKPLCLGDWWHAGSHDLCTEAYDKLLSAEQDSSSWTKISFPSDLGADLAFYRPKISLRSENTGRAVNSALAFRKANPL